MANGDQKRKLESRISDWNVKVTVWQCLTRTPNNLSAVTRELENHAGEEGYPEHVPDRATLKKICNELANLSPELVSTLPSEVQAYVQELNPRLREELERLKAGSKPAMKGEQEPYVETQHKQKMRELARALAGGIVLPSSWNQRSFGTDTWTDLPVDFAPGKYSALGIGVFEIGKNRQMKVNNPDIGAGIAEPHLVNALFSHLSTSSLPKFAELVGDRGKLRYLSGKTGRYSLALLTFLKLIADEVKVYRAKVNFHDELKPGLTKWFILTTWNDAIQKADGYSWIDDSWYKPHESITGTNLWRLRCGAYGIGIAKSNRTLAAYENWHKKLRAKYAEHQSAKDIQVKRQELSKIAQDISQRLHVFSDIEHLPGHCELC